MRRMVRHNRRCDCGRPGPFRCLWCGRGQMCGKELADHNPTCTELARQQVEGKSEEPPFLPVEMRVRVDNPLPIRRLPPEFVRGLGTIKKTHVVEGRNHYGVHMDGDETQIRWFVWSEFRVLGIGDRVNRIVS